MKQLNNDEKRIIGENWAKEYYEKLGFKIKKKHSGCDFVAEKNSQCLSIEVKVRNQNLPFITVSRKEKENIIDNVNGRLVEVKHDRSGNVRRAYIYQCKDIIEVREKQYDLYINRKTAEVIEP